MNEWINNRKNRITKGWMKDELITGKSEQLSDEWMN